jgi:hypothetical protein
VKHLIRSGRWLIDSEWLIGAGPSLKYGVLPNRHVVLWPYTRINSPHIVWGDRFVLVKATMDRCALKVGFPNPAGWLGYVLEGALFVKHAP